MSAAEAWSILRGMRARGSLSGSQADGFLRDLDRSLTRAAELVRLARVYAADA